MDELIFLKPVFHKKLWGGRRLETEYGYELPEGPVGECWAISAHPHGDCKVSGGTWDGRRLSELWEQHRELFGDAQGDRFPLLVKLLDAEDDLSIQVHPDDAYAFEHENGSLGKRECWYILDVHAEAHIVVGQHPKSREEFARLAKEGRWEEITNELPIREHDFFQVNPGTLHAILGGTLVLETQQSSDVTYRVYDFDRRQPDGTTRALQIEKALDVIDYDARPPVSGEVKNPEVNGITQLVVTPDYVVDRLIARHGAPVAYERDWPFLCASVIEGEGKASVGDAGYEVMKGQHFIVPAGRGALRFEGELTLIVSHI